MNRRALYCLIESRPQRTLAIASLVNKARLLGRAALFVASPVQAASLPSDPGRLR